nr:MAG TPA: hypothetical protein [Caudoviricetes sp.]
MLGNLNKMRRDFMENLNWDLKTIDNQNYFDLMELYSGQSGKPKMIPLAEFMKHGGPASIQEKGKR